ncbi:MAG: phenylalanine--tRNA ligase subunit beta [Candidatus Micrarchaeaceae archaeon]
MAIVTFGLDELESLGVAKQDIGTAVERLGMSLESIDGKSVTIDVTPNRPDMLDITGFARAANFLLGKKVPKEKFYTAKKDIAMRIKVTGAVRRTRPFISACVAKGVDLKGDRLKDLINFTEKFCETYGRKRKKIAVGMYDLDKISGPLTYDASGKGSFVPLGSKETMEFKDILGKHDKGMEYSQILGDSRKYPFLADSNGIMSLIPIVNSEGTKVMEKTKDLFVEMTGTSRKAVEDSINMIACSFIDSGAEIYTCEIAYPSRTVQTPSMEYKSIRVKRSKVERTLGIYLEGSKAIGLANKLGHAAVKYGSYTIAYVPPYRLDMLNEQDLIEDMAIAYGYEKIEPMPVVGTSNGLPDESRVLANRMSMLMIGMGFTEAMNTYLTNERLNFYSMNQKDDPNSTIRVAYAKTESITMLRTTLLPMLMQNLGASASERMPQRLFEIGSVFRIRGSNISEKVNIGIASEHPKANYSEIKSAVQELMAFMGCKDYKFEELNDPAFIKGRAARLIVKGDYAGPLGEINPEVLGKFRIEEPVVAAEIDISKLLR